jgi:hypothetical protein
MSTKCGLRQGGRLREAMEKKNNEPGWCNGKDYFKPSLCVHESRV